MVLSKFICMTAKIEGRGPGSKGAGGPIGRDCDPVSGRHDASEELPLPTCLSAGVCGLKAQLATSWLLLFASFEDVATGVDNPGGTGGNQMGSRACGSSDSLSC